MRSNKRTTLMAIALAILMLMPVIEAVTLTYLVMKSYIHWIWLALGIVSTVAFPFIFAKRLKFYTSKYVFSTTKLNDIDELSKMSSKDSLIFSRWRFYFKDGVRESLHDSRIKLKSK